MDILADLKEFILREFMHELDNQVLDEHSALIEEGIIDSMGLAQLVEFVEAKFGVKIREEEIEMDNFRTLAALSRLIERKL